ncbi:Ni/Fe-hydrogenase, b-type cytochrome subunit [Thermosulfurimonas sp. F29]|uniref:Ni/Fe-hydrogenase, b-type cytochrome subunit n=1 Tax=Thermosulfurimonas sp. F29 TaxID=2867247 RepID=UPI001C82C720|nr:Ni/Fe-hydrogenase, b-type cytochrome subunit [Thermosulfurimonas sp. F29]MBX6424036.1 Ni/Fe-hydrogenase, b-type cytochrome subunit [Thermosulfurimonas sp. F29]
MKREKRLYRRVFVWSWALRLFHWAFALSCAVLLLTGIYIHYPPITTKWAEFKPQHLMATLRYYHFAAAYVFMAALAVRIYLLFFGNRYERATDFLPVNRRNLRSFWQSLKFYLYLTDEHEWRMGHTVLAGTIYFLLFLAAITMSLTGLYMLYPDVSWIDRMGVALFGSMQMARFIHYILHWCFIFFVIVHLYIAIWNDFKAPEAIISGAFSGSKFMPADVEED